MTTTYTITCPTCEGAKSLWAGNGLPARPMYIPGPRIAPIEHCKPCPTCEGRGVVEVTA